MSAIKYGISVFSFVCISAQAMHPYEKKCSPDLRCPGKTLTESPQEVQRFLQEEKEERPFTSPNVPSREDTRRQKTHDSSFYKDKSLEDEYNEPFPYIPILSFREKIKHEKEKIDSCTHFNVKESPKKEIFLEEVIFSSSEDDEDDRFPEKTCQPLESSTHEEEKKGPSQWTLNSVRQYISAQLGRFF